MHGRFSIEPLASHPQVIPVLCEWFDAQWSNYYGSGGKGSALQDLKACANQGSLPVGMVALQAGRVCGFAALKEQSIESHSHLLPWAAAGLVHPSMRGRGIGGLLLGTLEEQARELGFERIHCATSSAHRLLQRRGWWLLDSVVHDGERLGVYARSL
jgi:GNAT superfamily N-acetyltransferase